MGNTASENGYQPPVWKWDQKVAENLPILIARCRCDPRQRVTRGRASASIVFAGNPERTKSTILFEELLEKGIDAAEYDAYIIDITEGDLEINPNSKILALLDNLRPATRVFESGSILLYLAVSLESFTQRACQAYRGLNWLFWQMGSAPMLGGGFGHFYAYALKN